MKPVDVRMRRQKWEWIGHTLREDEKCIARKAMEWNPLIRTGRLPGRPRKHEEELLFVTRRSSVKVGMI